MDDKVALKILEIEKDKLMTEPECNRDWELITALDIAIEDMQAWNKIKESGMPTLVIEDCAYILDKGCINALLEYTKKQNEKALEEFGDFLKEVNNNEKTV